MLVRAIPAAITASAAAIAALEEGEAGAAAGHATAGAANYAPEDGEDDEGDDDDGGNDGPPAAHVSQPCRAARSGWGTDLQYALAMQLLQLEKVFVTPFALSDATPRDPSRLSTT